MGWRLRGRGCCALFSPRDGANFRSQPPPLCSRGHLVLRKEKRWIYAGAKRPCTLRQTSVAGAQADYDLI